MLLIGGIMQKAIVNCRECDDKVGCILMNFFKDCSDCWLSEQCPFESPHYYNNYQKKPFIPNKFCSSCLKKCFSCTFCCFE
jgi:hypothetical protein